MVGLSLGWSHCSLKLLHLSGFPLLSLGEGISPSPALSTLGAPASEETKALSPKGFLPAAPHLPFFKGCEPVWYFWPAASAAP